MAKNESEDDVCKAVALVIQLCDQVDKIASNYELINNRRQ